MKYSVAIRTLGTSGDLLKRELESLQRQTIRPSKVVIYIAKGYKIPDFRVKDEDYVYVDKGMVAQQAMDYAEIDTHLILKLDDDVEFKNGDDVERMIKALEGGVYDCIVADTFKNHEMSLKGKIVGAITNLAFPRFKDDKAFVIRKSGSFSYINNPKQDIYPSESGAGPCSLWRKDALRRVAIKDELWLDKLGFAYGDDQIIFQKLVKNGGRLGAFFHSGITHNDGKSSSGAYHRDSEKFAVRAMGQYLLWHRSVYSACTTTMDRIRCTTVIWSKIIWMLGLHFVACVPYRSLSIPLKFIKGIKRGIEYTKSEEYKTLNSFIQS